jgi:TrmH family RNA methyltransferase
MNAALIHSRDNPLVRTFKWAAEQSRRAPAGLVLAEGLRVLEEAAKARCRFDSVLLCEDFGAAPRERALMELWKSLEVSIRFGSAALMKSLSEVISHQGALALVQVPEFALERVPEVASPLLLCLCGVQDPGNLGTLLRTARAAGITMACTTPSTVSARNPKAIRASAGAFFHIPVIEGLSPRNIVAYCRERGIRMFRADARGARSCWDINLRMPAAIFLGNEARGFEASDVEEAMPVRIPMSAGVESLNVAAAGAVLLFEALRQRAGR